MAKTLIHRFGRRDETEAFLQGGIAGGSFVGTLFDLNAKTLIFSAPAAETVTFVASPATPQASIGIKSIIDQIVAQTTDLIVRAIKESNGFRLVIIHDVATPTAIVLTVGTANTQLGFSDAQAGTTYNTPDGAAPRWLSLTAGPLSDSAYTVVTEE